MGSDFFLPTFALPEKARRQDKVFLLQPVE